jgi:hypothetical protein
MYVGLLVLGGHDWHPHAWFMLGACDDMHWRQNAHKSSHVHASSTLCQGLAGLNTWIGFLTRLYVQEHEGYHQGLTLYMACGVHG